MCAGIAAARAGKLLLSLMGPEGLEMLWKKFFYDPADFTWVIVGDIPNIDNLEIVLSHYVGKMKKRTDINRSLAIPYPTPDDGTLFGWNTQGEKIVEHVLLPENRSKKKSGALAQVCVAFHLWPEYIETFESRLQTRLLVNILRERVNTKLREGLGGTYQVGADLWPGYAVDRSYGVVKFEFTCSEQNMKKLSKKLVQEKF